MLQKELFYAALGTGATCLATVLGAAMVFFFKKDLSPTVQRVFLGFAAGVMIAASVWSLLIPAMEMAQAQGGSALLPAGLGFVLGGGFLMLLDSLLPHLHPGSREPEGLHANWKRTTMIVLAVTLHNIPEGMAVGAAFAGVLSGNVGGAAAAALAAGIAIQNIPEGAIISLPLAGCGMKKRRAFAVGGGSGAVEPVGAAVMLALTGLLQPLLPWCLAFAAGAMLLVSVRELIPSACCADRQNAGTLSVLLGFVVMMLLDVALG